jgi:hypothetical protein
VNLVIVAGGEDNDDRLTFGVAGDVFVPNSGKKTDFLMPESVVQACTSSFSFDGTYTLSIKVSSCLLPWVYIFLFAETWLTIGNVVLWPPQQGNPLMTPLW